MVYARHAISRLSALLVLIALSFANAVPAVAGDCSGDSYTYDHGECHDTTGDTTDILIHSLNEGESLNQGMISRSRGFAGGSAAGRGGVQSTHAHSVAVARALTKLNSFVPVAPSPAIAYVNAKVDKAQRPQARRFVESALADFRNDAPAAGFCRDYVASASLFEIEAAFKTYNGTRFTDPNVAGHVWISLASRLANRLSRLTDRQKQSAYDISVVSGYVLLEGAAEARKSGSNKDAVAMRAVALRMLLGLGIDPRKESIDHLACSLDTMPFPGSCNNALFFLTGGKIGTNPLQGP